MFRRPDGGIEMAMFWPDDLPVNRDLHLFVRYTTGDGRKLEVDGPVRVALPGDRVAGWIPTDPPRPELRTNPPAESIQPQQSVQVQLPSSRQLSSSASPRIAARPSRPSSVAAEPIASRPAWSPDRP